MDLEWKVMGFQFEPERSILDWIHEEFYQDSSDEDNIMEQDTFVRKDCDPSVWWKCRNCSTVKTEKECLCYQEIEAVCDFNLQAILVLSQAIILLELTHNLMITISICFCNQMQLEVLPCLRWRLFAILAFVYRLSSLVAKCSILYFAGLLHLPLGELFYKMSCFTKLKYFLFDKIPSNIIQGLGFFDYM